jgi:hypothetical protein
MEEVGLIALAVIVIILLLVTTPRDPKDIRSVCPDCGGDMKISRTGLMKDYEKCTCPYCGASFTHKVGEDVW